MSRESMMEQFNVWYRANCELSNTLNTRRQIEQAYYASRAQALDECANLNVICLQDYHKYRDDAIEAYRRAIKALKEQPWVIEKREK